ncbi:restriction endonuclease subunit S [Bacillus haynesii]|uniref:restriction endonuclease subunit S n=1 Tax=Bacillus haynesii TaxID=1925021 RepID=UPI00227FB80F|nr:restriction endonuclease subunit S [Bacillus haynesii]MCY9402400.1 restriction endonuclease subunit S [Bacillus haynesii]MEC0710262.1 restriction endonuclease subunit S [Bacillus haynesii]MEC0738862.1 restriction endonuclease subunit S [Bacillus haynesii]
MVKPGQHKKAFIGVASLDQISNSTQLRCSSRYNFFWQSLNGDVFDHKNTYNEMALSELILNEKPEYIDKGSLEDDVVLIELQDVFGSLGIVKCDTITDTLNSKKVILNDADLVYCKLDPERGKFFIPNFDNEENTYIGSTELIPLKLDKEKVYPPFLLRLLFLPEVQATLGLIKYGKCQSRADVDELGMIKLPIPDLDTQKMFVKSTSDDWNELTKLHGLVKDFTGIVDEGLESFLGETVFQPPSILKVSSKIIGNSKLIRFGQRFLSMSLEFDKKLKVSGKSVPLSAIATVRGGKRLPKGTLYENSPTNFRYLRGSDVENGKILEEQVVYIGEEAFNSIEKYQLKHNDVILTIAGTIGKLGIAKHPINYGVTENVALISSTNDESVLPDFLLYLFMSSFMQFQMRKEMSELRQQKLSIEKIRTLRVPEPPSINEQKRLVCAVNSEFNKNHKIIKEIETIKSNLDTKLRYLLGISEPEEKSIEIEVVSTSLDDEVTEGGEE